MTDALTDAQVAAIRERAESEDIPALLADRDRLLARIERLEELADKYKWQVRDTCTRAERAEAAIVEIIREWGNRGETTSLATWNERMKAAIASAKAIPNVRAALRAAGRLLEPGMVAVPLYRDPSENVEAERLRNVMRKAAAKLHAHNRPALPGQLRMDVRDMLIDGLYATAAATSEEKAR